MERVHEPRCNGPIRRYSSALFIVVIAGLNACGGGSGDSGTSVAPATCITTGPAPAVLTWDAVTGATGYRIYFDTEAGTNPQVVNVPGGGITTFTVSTELTVGTTYYFAATALNGSIESGFSNVVCKTIS